jgi:hypothetical protein
VNASYVLTGTVGGSPVNVDVAKVLAVTSRLR